MKLQILSNKLMKQFQAAVSEKLDTIIEGLDKIETPVDYFRFYNSVSSVYSSKIEGEEIDFDSYFKHKFLNISYKPDYTKRPDDLFMAYEYVFGKELNFENLKTAHSILSANLLPKSQQGLVRSNAMFVINSDDKIDFVAAEPSKLDTELQRLFADIEYLLHAELSHEEILYFGSYIHMVFVKIHPFQDGNGRSARLLEKWFLIQKLGEKATAIQLEKNYYINLQLYYRNLRILEIDYELLDYNKALDFLLMTVNGLIRQK